METVLSHLKLNLKSYRIFVHFNNSNLYTIVSVGRKSAKILEQGKFPRYENLDCSSFKNGYFNLTCYAFRPGSL